LWVNESLLLPRTDSSSKQVMYKPKIHIII
jgi:hypothetical protein